MNSTDKKPPLQYITESSFCIHRHLNNIFSLGFSKSNLRWHLPPRAVCLGRSSHADCLEKRRSNYDSLRQDEGLDKNKDSYFRDTTWDKLNLVTSVRKAPQMATSVSSLLILHRLLHTAVCPLSSFPFIFPHADSRAANLGRWIMNDCQYFLRHRWNKSAGKKKICLNVTKLPLLHLNV